jgi:hypothetical protein
MTAQGAQPKIVTLETTIARNLRSKQVSHMSKPMTYFNCNITHMSM